MVSAMLTFNRPDGRKYEGGWVKGKQDGKGYYTNTKGETLEGEWVNGKKVNKSPSAESKSGGKSSSKKKSGKGK